MSESVNAIQHSSNDIAVIGMAGRFPGAPDLDQFWHNLQNGVESVRYFTQEELIAAGESQDLLENPAYVKACPVLANIDQFDAGFFGFSPRDASIMDPQHRFFLETAWHAMENAGYNPETHGQSVGVFAGSGMNLYMMYHLISNPDLMESLGDFLVRHAGNDKDFLATRASYEMNLKGPSINVQTACSSSLVAVHLAMQSLLNGECDMAMAGGVTILLPQNKGYLFKEGEIMSPDGHCRAFDAESKGTIFGSGVGVVVLKRLDDAVADGDHILAVIKASAINNDGAMKVGYLAPSVEGQAKAITEAITLSGISPESISYVEAHGTGTLVGDPIEITAITQAYRNFTQKKSYCALGSLKTNIGHLGETAGIAGFIKTVLSLKNGFIPPSLNFSQPNPQIDFPESPFFVNTRLVEWKRGETPRRAGVTALGAGGTNAHVILEEAPPSPQTTESRGWHMLLLSAKTANALNAMTQNLAEHLKKHPGIDLADVAYTLAVGRKGLDHRRLLICKDRQDAIQSLETKDSKKVFTQALPKANPSVVFMFPGGGAQYASMGQELYETEPVYHDAINECVEFINPQLGLDLRTLMFPQPSEVAAATQKMERPSLALPTLFATEYALAKLLMSWGVHPAAMIGHSMGEYVAACLAGVFSYQDGLSLVTLRGRLFETLPEGGMLSVPLPEAEVRKHMSSDLSFAAINGPSLSVASGPVQAIAELEKTLTQKEIECTRIHINVAAHSIMLEPILAEFEKFCRTVTFKAPVLPYISNLTGTWITAEQATDPLYWVKHLRNTVRFADGLAELLKDPGRVLLEIGPGRTLSSLSKQQPAKVLAALSTVRHPKEEGSDVAFLLGTFGKLWLSGLKLNWDLFYAEERRRRIPLPSYPFEHQRFWVEPGTSTAKKKEGRLRKRTELSEWFYLPSWKRSLPPAVSAQKPEDVWLIFLDSLGVGSALTRKLESSKVVTVVPGKQFGSKGTNSYSVRPGSKEDFEALLEALRTSELIPDRIIHLWGITGKEREGDPLTRIDSALSLHFLSLFYLAQALATEEKPLSLTIGVNGCYQVGGDAPPSAEKILSIGPVRVIPHEFPHVHSKTVDVVWQEKASGHSQKLADLLLAESLHAATDVDRVVALRGGDRWVQSLESVRLQPAPAEKPWLRSGGVYLITGGLGGIGFEVAQHLVKACKAKLVLLGRSILPPGDQFGSWLAKNGEKNPTSRSIRRVQQLEALGAEVLVLSADVTDLDQMTDVIHQTKRRFGTVHGVFHTAGVLDDALIQMKTSEEIATVLMPKVKGALVLDEVLEQTPVDFLVLFSSVSSFLGLPGQVDYTAANAFLDAFAAQRTALRGSRTISINWSAWQKVGMVADIADRTRTLGGSPSGGAAHKPKHPLWQSWSETAAGEKIFLAELSREKHWLLGEHVVKNGEALIPGTGFLELVRSAWQEASEAKGIEITDVVFLAPFVVKAGESRELRLTFKPANGAHEFSIESTTSGDVHVTGKVRTLIPGAEITHVVSALHERCRGRSESPQGGFLNQVFMDFGPRWGNIQRIDYGATEALIRLSLPKEFTGDLAQYQLHPALLDMATGGAQPLIQNFDLKKDFFVPFSYGKVVIRRPLTTTLWSHVRYQKHTAQGMAVFDVTLVDDDGHELAAIRDFMMTRLQGHALTPGTSESSKPVVAEAPTRTSAATDLLNSILKEGILPSEGMEALDRILNQPSVTQIAACSVDLEQWRDQVERLAQPAQTNSEEASSSGPKFSRPNLQSEYAAPTNEHEKFLVAVWQELLGVDNIGIHDDFFELGGQSLIAVRLVNRIKKTYKLEFGLAVLFEAPTVAKCAALIREQLGVVADEPNTAETGSTGTGDRPSGSKAAKPGSRKSSCIVPINPKGTRPPFYAIHGMGGNIVEYSHIAKYLDPDQPFYGIQAQGLDGKKPILSRVDEIAATYIKEIREFQPEGPYYLGGSSFGGLVGYSMAQQLLKEGERVAVLALFDSYGKDYPKPLPATMAFQHFWNRQRYRFDLHLSNLRLLPADLRKEYVKEKMRRIPRIIRRYAKNGRKNLSYKWQLMWLPKALREQARLTGEDPLAMKGVELPKVLQEIQNATTEAARKYELRPYSGKVILLRASYQPPNIVNDPTNGWGELVRDLEIFEVPGHHGAIIREPRVKKLVEVLSSCLNRIQEEEATRKMTKVTKAS